jgi:hypothetical protein
MATRFRKRVASPGKEAQMSKLSGVVQSGGTSGDLRPLGGAKVAIRKNTSWFGQTVTDANGRFEFDYPFQTTDSIYYLQAEVSDDAGGVVLLMALLGRTVPEQATVNELTTIASAYAAAQFLTTDGSLTADALPEQIAAAMSANIVDRATGAPSIVLTQSPNAGQTIALGVTQSLANLLASAVRNPGQYLQSLFTLATSPDGSGAPKNTVTAMANIARWPGTNVAGIYTQSLIESCYTGPVAAAPTSWTVAVKVNHSGDNTRMFGGPANVAFDSRGRGWIPNNVIQGGPDSAPYSMALDLGGHPAMEAGRVISPVSGGGILGAGYGVVVDKKDRAWISDFGWTKDTLPVGSVSLFNRNGAPLSPSPNGYVNGLNRVQGLAFDGSGNLWLSSYGNHTVVVYPDVENIDDPSEIGTKWHSYPQTPDDAFEPFGIAIGPAIDGDQTAWVADSNPDSSRLIHLRFTGSAIEEISVTSIGVVLKGVVVDSNGFIWVASGGNNLVYRFDSNGTLVDSYGGTPSSSIFGPWGLCLDGNDNVWVANFGALSPSEFEGRLTQLAGTKQTTQPIGTELTPTGGYVLPTAGDPVLLADGSPLYGHGRECFIPMMRTTGVTVDAAGNVWSCNNWKPTFLSDTGDPNLGIDGNPGGDGVVIWVGVAKPV